MILYTNEGFAAPILVCECKGTTFFRIRQVFRQIFFGLCLFCSPFWFTFAVQREVEPYCVFYDWRY